MKQQQSTERHVPLGQIVITPNALDTIEPADICSSLRRHARGDWGQLDPHDVEENERALSGGFRLLSAYEDRNGTKFWIITEADRSVTTILLPQDY